MPPTPPCAGRFPRIQRWAWTKLQSAHSASDQDTLLRSQSFVASGGHRFELLGRLFFWCNVGSFAATRHGGPSGVDAALPLHVSLCVFQQFGSELGVRARQHGVTGFAIGVVL